MPYIHKLFSLVQDGLKSDKNFLLEQAKGTFLDTDWGTYPFVMASTTIPSAATAGLGIPPRYLTNVVAVTKAYTTQIGTRPLPTEINEVESGGYKMFREIAGSTGSTRRVSWLDLVLIQSYVMMSGVSELCLKKFDDLTGLDAIDVCVSYK